MVLLDDTVVQMVHTAPPNHVLRCVVAIGCGTLRSGRVTCVAPIQRRWFLATTLSGLVSCLSRGGVAPGVSCWRFRARQWMRIARGAEQRLRYRLNCNGTIASARSLRSCTQNLGHIRPSVLCLAQCPSPLFRRAVRRAPPKRIVWPTRFLS